MASWLLVYGLLSLFFGLISTLIAWPILRALTKGKLSGIQLFLIFLILFFSFPIYYELYQILHSIFNWAAPWHLNPFAPYLAFIGALIVVFVYYFLLFLLLIRVGRRNASIVSLILTFTFMLVWVASWTIMSYIHPFLP